MKGADIVMIRWDDAKNEFFHDDLFSHDFTRPQKDILQNYELISATFDDEGRIQAVGGTKGRHV